MRLFEKRVARMEAMVHCACYSLFVVDILPQERTETVAQQPHLRVEPTSPPPPSSIQKFENPLPSTHFACLTVPFPKDSFVSHFLFTVECYS